MPSEIHDIVSQHAEESAFLWCLRDGAVQAPNYSALDLARLDNRVEAHLDGLRVAGDPGRDIAFKAMADGKAGELFAAAVLAFENSRSDRIEPILEAATADPTKARAMVSALGWLRLAQAEPHLKMLCKDNTPAVRLLGLSAALVHRHNPGTPLGEALNSPDTALRARGYRALGELGLVTYQLTLRRSVHTGDPAARLWAAWSAALLFGEKEAVAHLLPIAEAKGPLQQRALQLVPRRLELRAAKTWQSKLAQKPENHRSAIIAAGAIGDPDLIPWLMGLMKEKPLARLAGEAFSMITGVDIAYQKLEVPPPEDAGAGPTEDPADENVAMDADDNLPWPNPPAIEKWWAANKSNYPRGTRLLLGKPLTPDWLQQVLRIGRQRQRAAAALELAGLQPERGLFEVRAPGFRQQKMLAT